MEQLVNPSDTPSTYLFSKYDNDGDLLDTGDQCGQIGRFFFAKRPPTQAGTPWSLNKDEQAELLKDLGGSCSRVLQVDWTQTGIKWGGGPAWLSKEDVEKEKGDGKGKRKAPA
ncbi:hypothetical protein N0V85_005962 [Neurospora sp. IMI 360204]|nr:hypothetical protein N0V85_005962 [Neurospora sp. IMI 360204]